MQQLCIQSPSNLTILIYQEFYALNIKAAMKKSASLPGFTEHFYNTWGSSWYKISKAVLRRGVPAAGHNSRSEVK